MCALHVSDYMSALLCQSYSLCVPSLAAGETELHGQFDITKVDLHPSEQYKSVSPHLTVLATEQVSSGVASDGAGWP